MPARDAAATVGQQLDALAAQSYDGAWELIVSDNGSIDGTRALAEAAVERLPSLRVVDSSGRSGPSAARNRGAECASGDLLVFCDADDVVTPGWLAAVVAAARDYDVVTGPQDPTVINRAAVQAWRPARSQNLPRATFLPYAPSCNLGVWADVFRAVGGFDETYRASEDVDFSWRAQLAGFTLGFAPDAVVHYRYREDPRGVARQAYLSGISYTRLYHDYRDRGMPLPPPARAARRWAWLVVRSPYLLSPGRRGVWIRRAGETAGRVRGSFRYRVVAP
jgi:GT2 family glycosyltransferase